METMVSRYEIMVLLPFDLGEKALSEELEKVRQLVNSFSGKVIFEDIIGDQKFVYKIKNTNRGYYVVLYCELTPEATIDLSKALRIEKNILRYLIVSLPSFYELKKSELKLPPRRTRRKEEGETEKKVEKPVVKTVKVEEPALEKPAVRKAAPKPKKEEEKVEEKRIEKAEEKIVEAQPEVVEKPEEKPEKKSAEKPSLESIEKKLQSIIDNPDIEL